MAVIAPEHAATIAQLREALRAGAIREYHGVILSVRVSGADIGDEIPRDVASNITYSVGVADARAAFPAGALDNLTPSNRMGSNARVVGPRRYSPCKLVVVDAGGERRMHFFPAHQETLDLYGCSGGAVLEVG